MILSIVTSPGVSGRRDETAIVDAALAASPYAGRVTGVYGIKAASCDRVGERWAKARGLSLQIIQPPGLPPTWTERVGLIVSGGDAVLIIGSTLDAGRLLEVVKWCGRLRKPRHWHYVRYSYDRWTDPA